MHVNSLHLARTKQVLLCTEYKSDAQIKFLKDIKISTLPQESPSANCQVVRHLEVVAQRSCGCPIPVIVQGQAGWGSDQPGPVKGVPALSNAVGTR